MALPDPSKMRPSMSSDTPILRLCPVNSTLLYRMLALVRTVRKSSLTFLTSIPEVPSNTCLELASGKSLLVALGAILGRQLGSLATCDISPLQWRGTG